ncbi:MAG: M20/M25/M40 family metallo-hydrolase [Cyanobacteria bacterium P01_F01_bin.42]
MHHQEQIYRHLKFLAVERDPFLHSSHYFFARTYIQTEMKRFGRVEVQRSPSPYGALENIILHLPCLNPDRRPVIIGAHYDTVPGTCGADDNASGVAVLLTLAETLYSQPLKTPVRLIAFDLEEYGLLGSHAYVESIKANKEKVQLVVSLEMLGYISESPDSQKYPPGLQYLYPNQGNFIALVGNLRSVPAMHRMRQALTSAGTPCRWLPVPMQGKPLPITRRSDHAPFWDNGYPAIMMTDTADLRNPHYHKSSDTIDTLNFDFMANLTIGLASEIQRIAL